MTYGSNAYNRNHALALRKNRPARYASQRTVKQMTAASLAVLNFSAQISAWQEQYRVGGDK
jgi:hypothetical protein